MNQSAKPPSGQYRRVSSVWVAPSGSALGIGRSIASNRLQTQWDIQSWFIMSTAKSDSSITAKKREMALLHGFAGKATGFSRHSSYVFGFHVRLQGPP